jgi:RNA polymerase sigma factor (sigma-70 family)
VESYSFTEDYLQRLARGDSATAEHFVGYFYKLLLAKLRAKMRSSAQAEDVAQETLCRVLQHVKRNGGIDNPASLGGFVNRVSENVLLESYRQGCRFQQVPENMPEPIERALDAERRYLSTELKERIRRELKKLKGRDQALLEKVFLREQDKDEICAEYKINRNYLRVQVCRALGRFRKILADERSRQPPAARKAAAG